MNTHLFTIINGWAGHSHLLDNLGIFFADKFVYLFLLFVALLWLSKKYRYYVYVAAISTFASRIIVVEAIKRIVNHPRPYEIVPNIHQLLVDTEHGMSFPSGHTVIFFSLAFSFYGTKFFWPFVILATLGSVARVFVGVHFPADIVASVIIAWLVVWATRRLFKKPNLS